jgi:hypothetical protein
MCVQSSVAVGEVGIAMRDPDEYSLDVLTGLFNSFGCVWGGRSWVREKEEGWVCLKLGVR